jgi:predicted nucleic acid-binding protein
MGLILDSSVLIAGERKGETVGQLLKRIFTALGDQDTLLSSIALVEIAHGIHRANTPQVRGRREAFVQELLRDVPVYPFTEQIALVAGKIDGEQQNKGIKIPFADLLIGATAVHLRYAVVTENIRHFAMIPDLDVKRL